MVNVSESASYDMGSATSIAKNSFSDNDFHQIKIDESNKTRSKLVASIFCSRRPGKNHLFLQIFFKLYYSFLIL